MNASPAVPASVSALRRVIVWTIIVSFGIAAIGGIVVLLGANLGEAAGRVLGTTAIVGTFSTAVLCCAALIGSRRQLVGYIGVAVSVVAAGIVTWMIWYQGDYGPYWDAVFRVMWTAVAASGALALASLLLLLADRRRPAVRASLIVTLALFAFDLALIVYLIWASGHIEGDVFPRVLGITSILAALGAVVVPVLSLLLPDRRPAVIAGPVAERLLAEAARRGVTVDELVAPVLHGTPAGQAGEPGSAGAART